MSDQITVMTTDGRPAVDVAGPDPLRLELVTSRPDPPETIDVTVTAGDETETVELTRAIRDDGTAVYQSQPFTLDDPYGELGWSGDLGLDDFIDGLPVTFSEGDTQTSANAWHQRGARDIGVAQAHLRVAEVNFRDARSTLEGMEQTPQVTEAVAELDQWLAFIRYLMAETAVYDEEFLGPDAYLARGIIRIVPLDPVATLTTGAGHMPGDDRDDWESWANGRRAAHREVRRDTFTSGMSDITIGGYQLFTDYTGTSQLYTIFSGENVMGKEVGLEGQVAAAADLALGYLTGKVADRAIDKYTELLVEGTNITVPGLRRQPRTRTGPTRRPTGSDPDADVTGARVDHNEYGIRDEAARVYRAASDATGLHPVIRPASKPAMVYQGMGCPGKDTRIKNKTTNEIDAHIGGPTRSPIEHGPDSPNGLVGAFQPTLPHRPDGISDADWQKITTGLQRPDGVTDEAWAATTKAFEADVKALLGDYKVPGVPDAMAAKIPGRYAQRMSEWAATSKKLKKLEEEGLIELRDGLIIDTGLYGGTGKPVTGDYDLFAIVDAAGNKVDLETARTIIDMLKKHPETYTLHGAHMDWPDEVPFNSDWERVNVYEAIIGRHETEALLVFGGRAGGAGVATHSQNGVVVTRSDDGKLIWQREAPVPYRTGEMVDSGEIRVVSFAERIAAFTRAMTDEQGMMEEGSEAAFDQMAADAQSRTADLEASLAEGDAEEGSEAAFDQMAADAQSRTADLEASLAEGESAADEMPPLSEMDDLEESEPSEEPVSEGSEAAFDQMAADAQSRTEDLEASLAEGDEESEGFESPEESERSEEPAGQPTSMFGAIPGLVWGILAAIAAVVILVIALTSGGGSPTATTGAAVGTTGVTTGSTTGTTGPPTTGAAPATATFGTALQDLVEADPATFGLLQNFAQLLSQFDFPWDASAESAFELFNIRQTGATANHPDGSTTGTQGGASDIVKVIASLFPMAQGAVDAAFNQSDFPCGEGEVAMTFCTDAAPDVPAGDVVMVGATLDAAVPLDGADRSYLFFVGFEDGDPANNLTEAGTAGNYGIGTDRRYLLSYSPDGGWVFEVEGVEDSAARFIVLDDAVLLMVPAAELGASPTFRFATFENAGGALDVTNTSDWAGDAVPNVGAQLLPIGPLEPPSPFEAGSAEDPSGDGACGGALDVTGVTYLVRGRQARFLLALADDPSGLIGEGIGLDISMDHPGGERSWSIAIAPNRTTLRADDPSLGENPTVFTPSGPEIDVLFDSALPSGSTLTFVTRDAADTTCDEVTFTVP